MSSAKDPLLLSLEGFETDAGAWATASPDDVSLSKYSILSLLDLTMRAKLKEIDQFAFYLRAAALKREHEGASRFILWSFADSPPGPTAEVELFRRNYGGRLEPKAEERLCGIGPPTGEWFQIWLAKKSSGTGLTVPKWDLPLLADYADEFLHLSRHLELLSQEYDSTFPGQARTEEGVFSLAQALDAVVYFGQKSALISLAPKVLERAAGEHRENPVDLLLQAFEGIGLTTRRTLRSENVEKTKDSTARRAQLAQDKSEEQRQSHLTEGREPTG